MSYCAPNNIGKRYQVRWSGYAEGEFAVIDTATYYRVCGFSPHWSGTANARRAAFAKCDELNGVRNPATPVGYKPN